MNNGRHKSPKADQAIKIDKDNENMELQRRMKRLLKDKNTVNKKETVWDRLSKPKKVLYTENNVGDTGLQSNLTTATLQHFQAVNQPAVNTRQHQSQQEQLQSQPVIRKPLSPNPDSINKRSHITKKLRLPKTDVVSGTENVPFLNICKNKNAVKEIMSVRSLNGSKSSLECRTRNRQLENKSNCAQLSTKATFGFRDAETSTNNAEQFSEDSSDEYKSASLMYSQSLKGPKSSTRIINNFREVLRYNEKSMALEDIELVKDVIKTDNRYSNIGKNPKLFKNILQTQLQNILKHELVVQKALDNLESSVSSQQNYEIVSSNSIEEVVGCSKHNIETQKLEVGIIFKNVPSLEKEIVILRALGEKLEATLRSSRSQSSLSVAKLHEASDLSIQKFKTKNMQTIFDAIYEINDSAAQMIVRPIGICHLMGIINEFSMSEKTIAELKQDANNPFYISHNSESTELTRTSFNKLKENPNELLRHIRAKSALVPFNILDQDPIFFNNIIYGRTRKYPNTNNEHLEEKQVSIKQVTFEGGDNPFYEKIDKLSNKSIQKNIHCVKIKSTIPMEAASQIKRRRPIKRCLTPMPIHNYYSPKNTLFRTILVGFVQMFVFMLLIMALSFPDIMC